MTKKASLHKACELAISENETGKATPITLNNYADAERRSVIVSLKDRNIKHHVQYPVTKNRVYPKGKSAGPTLLIIHKVSKAA